MSRKNNPKRSAPPPFSQQLDAWLKSKEPKTLEGLTRVFAEKSFAILFVVLMCISALPLPTGGITHIFEIINMLVALELIIGRRTVWLPKKWLKRPLGKTMQNRTLPYLNRKIRWLEKYSRRRLGGVLEQRYVLSLVGLTVLILTVATFLAPPFSGLDTLPSVGVVGIGLALILEDMALYVVALMAGVTGIVLELTLGAALVHLTTHFYHLLIP